MERSAGYSLVGQDWRGEQGGGVEPGGEEAATAEEAPFRPRSVRLALGAGAAALAAGCLALASAALRRPGLPAGAPPAGLVQLSALANLSWVGGGVDMFERNGMSPYLVARDVCVRRRFEDCGLFTDRNHFHREVTLNNTFENYLLAEPLPPSEEHRRVPGSTVLFTVAHCHKYFRWNNIAHFSRELIPLANTLDASGHDLARNALVWEAPRATFTGAVGFRTDWYLETLASELLHGRLRGHAEASHIFTCEQVPPMSGGGRALCFERLVAFREPQTCDPPVFPSVAACGRFQSRVYQRLGLSPPAALDASTRVLALIRTDPQGWSNYLQAAADIAGYVGGLGGNTTTIFLNASRMTLQEQVRWFMSAGAVVTTHGAHEENLLFARRGTFHIEYFKRNHWTFAFSRTAVSCGLRYVAVHSKDTDFRSHSRTYLNKPMPLDFRLELRPVLGLALGVATHGFGANGTYSCPFLIAPVSRRWRCVSGFEGARAAYAALRSRRGHRG